MSYSNSTLVFSNGASPMHAKSLAVPFLKCVVLCLLSILVLVAVLGPTKPIEATHYVYQRYSHYSQVFLSDFPKEVAFLSDMMKPKVLRFCSKGVEHYVPCYNITANVEAGFLDGKELDRHCEVSKLLKHCLWPSPNQYRLPLKWPSSRDTLWSENIKIANHLDILNGRSLERSILMKENKITFISKTDGSDTLYNYLCQIKRMISLGKDTSFSASGIRTALDFSSTYASLAVHLLSENVLTMSLAPYEVHGSQVQIALERGLPAVIASLQSMKLPFSPFSFDMVHCLHCGINWHQKDGVFAIEVDRILHPGGYVVWTSTSPTPHEGLLAHQENASEVVDYITSRLCWKKVAQQDQTTVWQKSAHQPCYSSWMCEEGTHDINAIWYQPLQPCIMKVPFSVLHPVEHQTRPNQIYVEPFPDGIPTEKDSEDAHVWLSSLNEIWSLLTPLIFSDHPKRPGDEDPKTPSNVVRNVMDMNAQYGKLNAALALAGKSVWVMNVVPTSGPNTLSAIYRRGFLGVLHDWCEAFPTYPRTYDMLYAANILSQELRRRDGCKIPSLFLEMDRILRPEGWILLQDDVKNIEEARAAAAQMQWEMRVVEVAGVQMKKVHGGCVVCRRSWVAAVVVQSVRAAA
ncbi:hypothetical protein O6H91_12G042300 [Diphasiastrum complanatum]|uniref:Uncharacterized protein n=2 Tax=Diphasiastrum complanatum TaxID=34168 RepID=A0ACC2C0Y4_DIPCM|nr:hypothetical protein O6H91_12G042300 [Diphasiastrum complanatum]KAJ7535673.1 hypothetical protein O6H91_12G042300 [Diphasiastrum complanatum]